jgi:adenylate kinase
MKAIVITGVPGSGKTTIANNAGKILGIPVVHANDLIKSEKLYSSKAADGSLIVKMPELNRRITSIIRSSKSSLIVEGHVLCEIQISGAVAVVIRQHLRTTLERLKARGYSAQKLRDNMISEALDYCGERARKNYSSVYEIIGNKSSAKVLAEIIAGRGMRYLRPIDLSAELMRMLKKEKNAII